MSLFLSNEMKENIEIYDNVVNDLKGFFISIGIGDDPVKVSETFYYMCMNSYLSSCSCFKNDSPYDLERLEDLGRLPIDVTGSVVFTGHGVCRHQADFLNHIFIL